MTHPEQIIAAMMRASSNGNEEQQVLSPEMTARRLLDHYDQLVTAHEFKPGDLAQLKPGFGTEYNQPAPGAPVIITERIDPPFVDQHKGSGTPQCMIKHDVRIAVIDDDGGFVQFIFSSRYLEPYTGKIET